MRWGLRGKGLALLRGKATFGTAVTSDSSIQWEVINKAKNIHRRRQSSISVSKLDCRIRAKENEVICPKKRKKIFGGGFIGRPAASIVPRGVQAEGHADNYRRFRCYGGGRWKFASITAQLKKEKSVLRLINISVADSATCRPWRVCDAIDCWEGAHRSYSA